MNLILELRNQEQFSRLAQLDMPHSCHLCHVSDTRDGLENLRILSEWWLAGAQRESWGVSTLIQGRQEPARPSMDAVFKIVVPGRNTPIPILLVICQHYIAKNWPHYQLQIPTGDVLKSLKSQRQEILPLYNKCETVTRPYWVEDRKSISLHEPLSEPALPTILSSISTFVSGVVKVIGS